MEKVNLTTLVIFAVIAVALIAFLVWKNQQDKKKLNPDTEDSVEETIADKERSRDKL